MRDHESGSEQTESGVPAERAGSVVPSEEGPIRNVTVQGEYGAMVAMLEMDFAAIERRIMAAANEGKIVALDTAEGRVTFLPDNLFDQDILRDGDFIKISDGDEPPELFVLRNRQPEPINIKPAPTKNRGPQKRTGKGKTKRW